MVVFNTNQRSGDIRRLQDTTDRDMPIIHLMQNTDSGITAAAEEVPQEKRLAGSQRVRLR